MRNIKICLLRSFVVALFIAISGNVMATYTTYIEAYGNAPLSQKKFTIIPIDEKVSPKSLEWKEYKRIAAAYFSFRDAIEVEDTKDADYVIHMRYWHEDEEATGSSPIWGQGGATKATTRKDFMGRLVTDYQYSDQVVGYHDYTYTKNYNYIEFYLFDNRSSEHELLWQAVLEMRREDNIRNAFPIMMYQSRWYLGKKTDGKQKVENYSYKFSALDDREWVNDPEYNDVLRYVNQGKPVRQLLWMDEYGRYGGQAEKFALTPDGILQGQNSTTIIFSSNNWYGLNGLKISNNIYIECNGVRYKALRSTRIKLGEKFKDKTNPLAFNFTITFEKIPDDANLIVIRDEAAKGKVLFEWYRTLR